MIDPASEELVEGGKYLQAFDNTFDPEDTKKRNQYDFQLVLKTMYAFGLEKYIKNILEIILFDAFIGNSDRHQENWAFINTHSSISKPLSEMVDSLSRIEGREDEIPSGFTKWLVKKFYMAKGKVRPEFKQARLMLAREKRFAPIYDSGCSFGRELKNKKVIGMLSDQNQLNSYLNKGMAEIHWEKQKINHFELLDSILSEEDFRSMLLESMGRVLDNYDKEKINDLIWQVDRPLKQAGVDAGLPDERKALMIKLLALRRERIAELHTQYRK